MRNFALVTAAVCAAAGLALLAALWWRGRAREVFVHPFAWLCLMGFAFFYKRCTVAGMAMETDLFVAGGLALVFAAFWAGYAVFPARRLEAAWAARPGLEGPPDPAAARAPFDIPPWLFWTGLAALWTFVLALAARDGLLHGDPFVLAYASSSFGEEAQKPLIRWFNRYHMAFELVLPSVAAFLFVATHRPGARLAAKRYRWAFLFTVAMMTVRYTLMGYRTYLVYLPLMFFLALALSRLRGVKAMRRGVAAFLLHAAVCAALAFVLPFLRDPGNKPLTLPQISAKVGAQGRQLVRRGWDLVKSSGGGTDYSGGDKETAETNALRTIETQVRASAGAPPAAGGRARRYHELTPEERATLDRRAMGIYLKYFRSRSVSDWAGWIKAWYGEYAPPMGFWRTPKMIALSFVPKEAYGPKPYSFGSRLVMDQWHQDTPRFGAYAGPFGEGYACGGWAGYAAYSLAFGFALGLVGRFARAASGPALFGRFMPTTAALAAYGLVIICFGGDIGMTWRRFAFSAVSFAALWAAATMVRFLFARRPAGRRGTGSARAVRSMGILPGEPR